MLKKTVMFTLLMIIMSITIINAPPPPTDPLANALLGLCNGLMGLIGPLAFLLVTFAALVYLAGQLGDAQTRAKAQTWAVSCIFGAVIGWLIITIVPQILAVFLKASGITIDNCSFDATVDGPCTTVVRNNFCN